MIKNTIKLMLRGYAVSGCDLRNSAPFDDFQIWNIESKNNYKIESEIKEFYKSFGYEISSIKESYGDFDKDNAVFKYGNALESEIDLLEVYTNLVLSMENINNLD